MQEQNEFKGNINTPVPGHYIDALLATKETLLKSDLPDARIIAENSKLIDLGAIEHRMVMALLSIYDEKGYDAETFKKGISFTTYELCKRMGYRQDKKGRFGGKIINKAFEALKVLSGKRFTVYFVRFKRKKKKQDVFDVIALPNWPLLRIVYEASDVSKEEMLKGRLAGKTKKIHLRIEPLFFNIGYFMLFENDFYPGLKTILEKQGRRVTKYHWNLAIWCLKHKGRKKPIEINVDKLVARLKISCDPAHTSRARSIVRQLYEDFKLLGYISDYKIDVPAQTGKTKDIIVLRG